MQKGYKLFDGGGLYLLVMKTGGKLWRFKHGWSNDEGASISLVACAVSRVSQKEP